MHKTKKIMYNGRKVSIDIDIVPLLTKMWALGIRTYNSCQGQCSFLCGHKTTHKKRKDGIVEFNYIRTKECNNNVWIAFDSTKDVEKLYNIVAEWEPSNLQHEKSSMYVKMGGDRAQRSKKLSPEDWSLNYVMRNHGVLGHWGRPKWGNKRSTCILWCEDDCKKNKFVIEPQLTFPRTHLQYVESKLDAALARKKK
jgi:hypothetical protein